MLKATDTLVAIVILLIDVTLGLFFSFTHDCFRADKHRYVPLYKRHKRIASAWLRDTCNHAIHACTIDIGKFVSQSTIELHFRNVISPDF